jgi:hypothetical protein
MTVTEVFSILLGSTALSTTFIAIVTAWIKRGDRKLDEAGEIRKEQREQNDQLLARIQTIEKELDIWKGRYFTLQELYATEKVTHSVEASSLKREIIELREEKSDDGKKIVKMQTEIDALKVQVRQMQYKK